MLKPTLNQADVDLLNKLLDQKFEKQQEYIDRRFAAQDKKIDERFAQVDERFQSLPEQIENISRQVIREEAITKEELDDKLKNIPTKEEYFIGRDKIMKELKTVREEQAAHMALHDRIEKRLQRVEKKTGITSTVN